MARLRRVARADGTDRWDLAVQDRLGGASMPAVAFSQLGAFAWRPGQRVWVNATARCLGLGTGGFDWVIAPCSGRAAPPSVAGRLDRRHGHIMKLRYTPLQLAVLACEEPRGAYHRCARHATTLAGLPVAVLPLHSLLAPVVCGFVAGWGCGEPPRLAFVMTDSAALTAGISRLLSHLVRRRLLQLVVTAGQAFGGHLEAVHPASALAACAAAGVDAVLVGPGPGVVGTGTALGTTCLEVAAVADLAASLGGRPVVVMRLSFAERRRRHRGVSHHLLTALGRLACRRHEVVLPAGLPRRWRRAVLGQLASAGILRRHRVVEVASAPRAPLLALLGASWTTMGRSADQDPAAWDAGAAAGQHLARLAAGRRGGAGAWG